MEGWRNAQRRVLVEAGDETGVWFGRRIGGCLLGREYAMSGLGRVRNTEGIITSHENETMILNGLGVMRSREK